MNIFKPISYIASLAPREVTLLALV
ncbi:MULTISPECIES: protein YibX-S [Gammaproteobacteria]|uniref:Isoform Ybix-S of Protein YibX n=2 Tax=Escherichia coli TaxID=562 RepID=P0DSH3-2|nr:MULTISPECIES: protein YibX-S [Gammaproteobacteria]YP_010051209.1 protein YibX-S [Escherichia coli str. K-12 substr. MG1655]MBW2868106.1 hypothetical protein [Escherichia coli]MBX0340034.1 hypothetical protein [Escherichia coli]MCH1287990.1 hypothetical protein [Pseudomonas aeruginosa]QNV50548.1 protein YibX-S [Escherichia coli str. K-12 substr. MG1655]